MSKGSTRRKSMVNDKEVEDNWNRCFRNLVSNKPMKYSVDVEIGRDAQNERINKYKGK